MGVGIAVSKSPVSFNIIPTFLYRKTCNDHWGVEMLLPANAKVRYNLSPPSMILAGLDNSTYDYFMSSDDENVDGVVRLKRLYTDLSVTYERQLSGWVWGFVSAGYQWNHNSDFFGINTTDANFEAMNKPFFEFGVFLSPSL